MLVLYGTASHSTECSWQAQGLDWEYGAEICGLVAVW
jgi:hypothetical protein